MKSYRIYIVGDDGRLALGQAFQAEDDRAAGLHARAVAVQGELAELWEGGRLVGKVLKTGVFLLNSST